MIAGLRPMADGNSVSVQTTARQFWGLVNTESIPQRLGVPAIYPAYNGTIVLHKRRRWTASVAASVYLSIVLLGLVFGAQAFFDRDHARKQDCM